MSTSDRVAIKELVQTTLTAAFAASVTLTDVVVHYGDPGELIGNHMVILGQMNGTFDDDVVKSRSAGGTDRFTIQAEILTTNHPDALTADRKAQDILDVVNAAIFTTSFLQSLNGRCEKGKQDGPNSVAPYDNNPAASVVEFDIGVAVPVRGA